MKTKFNHIKGRDNLFMHKTCNLYLLQRNTNWYMLSAIKNMLTNKRADKEYLKTFFASVCRRCFDKAMETFAKEDVLVHIEI